MKEEADEGFRWLPQKALVSPPVGQLTPREKLQRIVIWFVFPAYVLTILATVALLFLVGFSVVELPDAVVGWIGPAVIGESVTSAGMIITYIFRDSGE